MSQEILISKENCNSILIKYIEDILNKISDKDISADYTNKFNLADKIKIDGTGTMFLFNNGEYIKLDPSKLNLTKSNINIIYDLFNITTVNENWETKQSMPVKSQWLSSAIYKNNIYVLGGYDPTVTSNFLNINECYNIESNTWNTKTPLPTQRYSLGSCAYDTKIFSLGGYDGSKYTNVNECYDIITNTWSTKTNMLYASCAFGICIYENRIYCIGGSNGSSLLTVNQCYDVLTTWSNKTAMSAQRYELKAVLNKDKIYCIGGRYGDSYLTINECYDIITNTWSTKVSMPTGRYGFVCNGYKGEIYAIGGSTVNECYDVATDTWKTKLNIKTPRSGITSCIYKNKIYIIGGGLSSNEICSTNEVYTITDTFYDLILPSSIQDKLDIIKNDGNGNLLLSNKGQYLDIVPEFTIIDDTDIDTIIDNCFGGGV